MNWQLISEQIEIATGMAFRVSSVRAIHGGDINSAFRLQGEGETYFVKLNRTDLVTMFEAEFAGLQEMANTQTVRVPAPVVCGKTAEHAFLALENLEFGSSSKASDRLLGRQLAQMHQQIQPYFGWQRDNTIGSTKQPNSKSDDWLNFWREQRLEYQLKLAADNGYRGKLQANGELLLSDMEVLFYNYRPKPSLLHGDLWGGNAAVDKNGSPVVFDPACYYGDREADLAMTELFGGFSQDFYAAYQEVWSLDQGYAVRKIFYNLYHILNHLNLFGGGYLRQAENTIAMIRSEIS
ncbi:MAG: fructosamine kinase family protein [Methylobacter sp.]|nr:fructosamine kinase family protein [Methylobacter sp.]